jgi:FkbM family methyltransferase
MKMRGREIPIAELVSTGFTFLQCLSHLFIVKHPFTILKHYIKRDSPAFIELKGGARIILSSHPGDLSTFFVIFLKKDYGEIEADSVVVDVGANIGIFSIFAALSGARKVYAFEPSQEAFQILCENIRLNNLTDIIIPINKAVSVSDDVTIKFPRFSNPCNKIESGRVDNQQDYCAIQTINLGSYICRNADIGNIDLLKLDCEGAEFDILPSMSETAFARIRAIRMECHGEPNALINHLIQKGYGVDLQEGHNIWLKRRST